MSVRTQWQWLIVCGLVLASTGVAQAENTDPKYTVTDPHAPDADLQLQGEFWGNACLNQGWVQGWGLQVVASGSGRFQAQLLSGGLPGNGWNGTAPVPLQGERTGDAVNLAGGSYKIVIPNQGQTATIYSVESNAVLGTLTRVTRVSQTMGAPVAPGGTLLFGGETNSNYGHCGIVTDLASTYWEPAKVTEEGLLLSGSKTKNAYDDFQLHLEFRVPFMPNARSQARGNSGAYLNGRQEVQILDSFGLEGAINEAGSLYKFKKPDLNMALPPLTWQTYDISYKGAKFDAEGKKLESVVITVRHNGVVVQNNVVVDGPTGNGAKESSKLLPLTLQDHGNPVVFRNVWIAPLSCVNTSPVIYRHRRRR